MYPAITIATLPAWAFMWLIAIAIYVPLKGVSWQLRSQPIVADWKRRAYLLGWPGMDAGTFVLPSDRNTPPPSLGEWGFAFAKLGFGVAMLFVLAPRVLAFDPTVAGWFGMIGIVFSLHFGLFHLLSLVWRTCGLCAEPIMNWPIASQSLTEFWGRRWNRAFRDLTHRLLFRPLLPPIGPVASLIVGFVVSGLIHELVISVPAAGGYGGPTAFFSLQAAGIIAERSRVGRRIGLGHGLRGRGFCALVLLVPISLLFHHSFVYHVMVPFLQAIRDLNSCARLCSGSDAFSALRKGVCPPQRPTIAHGHLT